MKKINIVKNTCRDELKTVRGIRIIHRLIFDIIVFLIFIILGTVLLNHSFNYNSERIINYNEKSNLDYKVYLLRNEFYEHSYLEKDMLYIASLIDNITIDFDYIFQSDGSENIDFTYNIVAKLSISSASNTKDYFVKTYKLLEDKKINMINNNFQNIHEQIVIDYQYYNLLANQFNNQYGIDASSKLIIYMIINKKNGGDSNFVMNSDSVMNIVIPLSERAIDISLDYNEINEARNIIEKQTITLKNIVVLIISVLMIIISLLMMVRIIRNIQKLIKKKSIYDKYVGKILKEYDRLIAESSSLMSFDDKEIIKINKFTELLDIHDNLQVPIMYYSLEAHRLCYFYISHNNIIYLLKIDNDDLVAAKKV